MNRISPTSLLLAAMLASALPTALIAAPICGDHLLEAGETCESCAADCTPAACKATTKPLRVEVEWQPSTGQEASSLTLVVAYRTDRVALPGSGATPQARLADAPANAIVLLNDLDHGVKVVLTKSGPLAPGRVFTLDFDRCAKAPVATAADFSCRVEGCATAAGDVQGCTCRVVVP